jgi:drug/metabolite transporter (DMT)-like permease
VPVLSAVLGVMILSEEISWIGGISALITLGGVAWVTLTAKAGQQGRSSTGAEEPSR